MKFLKSKFFLISLIIIFFIFLSQFYFISQSYKVDRNSYVTLIKGNGILTSGTDKTVLSLNKKELLKVGDIVSIIGSESLGIIEWGDKSITRLSGNSKIIIKENLVSEDLDKVNISFELLKGKTWSNVITIIGNNSYFKQDIKGVTASVRGTVFEANYDNDYLYVKEHEVNVTNSSGEIKKVFAGEGFKFSSFSLENILKIKDELWENLNKDLDIEYYNKLREEYINTLKNHNFFEVIYNFFVGLYSPSKKVENFVINSDYEGLNEYLNTLTGSQKEEALDILKTISQKLNFEGGENLSLYDMKLNIKNILLENIQDQNYKEILLKYSMYDFSQMLNYENVSKEVIEKTLNFINSNQELIDIQSGNFDFFKGQLNSLKDFLINGNSNEIINKVKDKLIELDATGKEALNGSLDSLLNIFKK